MNRRATKSTLVALAALVAGSAIMVLLTAASLSTTLRQNQPAQFSTRTITAAHAITVSHKKKKQHGKKKPSSHPLLPSDFGNVPVGRYEAAYSIDVPGFEDTGWVNDKAYVLSDSEASAFTQGLDLFSTEYNHECASEGSSLGVSGWSCSETYQPWNGSSFGFSFTASGSNTGGIAFSETIALRYTKIG
jgi:hypothetical protein